MTIDWARAHALTVRLFMGDTVVNWILGIALSLFPGRVSRLLTAGRGVPVWVYVVIGAGFLLFAVWQSWILGRRYLERAALRFAAAMALGPVVGLTAALLWPGLDLRPLWRAVLWVGDAYMAFLGVWYLLVAARRR